ncbi:MAG: efflux RND transporter periplasmic adaptor subunit [Deltaproteobacteria bacterium]|nr:efflux RND transporter periplasmic adaptor subunit [Deltaproteobacteria bacterium]
MKKILAIFIICIALSLGCSSSTSKETNNKKKIEESIPVQVARLKKEPLRLEICTVGTVLPHQEVVTTPKIAGRVERIFVKEGDLVKAGDVIVKLEETDFLLAVRQAEAALATAKANLANLLAGTRPEKIEQARAALHQAQANLTSMEKEYQRIKQLAAADLVAKRELDVVIAQYESAIAQVRQAKEQLDMLIKGPTDEELEIARAQVRQAEAGLAVAKNTLSDTILKAPFAGLITARFVDEGVQVYTAPKTEILKLTDVSRVKVVTPVSERDFSRLKIGTPCEIKLDALPGDIYQGRVTRIIPEINPVSRNFNVEVEIPNPNLRLKSGMFANIRLFVGQKETLTISRDILITDLVTGVSYAFVVEGDQAVRRKLTLGERSGLLMEVLEGLKEGENLVVKGQNRLQPGSKVKIIKESIGESK